MIGQILTLDFGRSTRRRSSSAAVAYHQQLQNDFFAAYQIEDIESHVIKPGESLWILAARKYNVPVWLLRQYNPDLNSIASTPGAVVKFPRLKAIAAGNALSVTTPQVLADTELASRLSPMSTPSSESERVLAGKVVAVPEARQLDVLADLLERRGAAVLRCPLVSIVDPRRNRCRRLDRAPRCDAHGPRRVLYRRRSPAPRRVRAPRGPRESASSARWLARRSLRAARSRNVRCQALELESEYSATEPTTAGMIETANGIGTQLGASRCSSTAGSGSAARRTTSSSAAPQSMPSRRTRTRRKPTTSASPRSSRSLRPAASTRSRSRARHRCTGYSSSRRSAGSKPRCAPGSSDDGRGHRPRRRRRARKCRNKSRRDAGGKLFDEAARDERLRATRRRSLAVAAQLRRRRPAICLSRQRYGRTASSGSSALGLAP